MTVITQYSFFNHNKENPIKRILLFILQINSVQYKKKYNTYLHMHKKSELEAMSQEELIDIAKNLGIPHLMKETVWG